MKTKALISCAVTAQLICFIFAYAKSRFSHDAQMRHILSKQPTKKMLIRLYSCKLVCLFAVIRLYSCKLVCLFAVCKCIKHVFSYHPFELDLSRVVRKPAFCICKNKDADQLRGNREADQRVCFRYTDSTIPLLPKYEILSLLPSSVAVQPGLCRTWSETPKTGFLTTRLI